MNISFSNYDRVFGFVCMEIYIITIISGENGI
jgi:hypothetical protein